MNNFAFKTIGGEESNDLLEAKGISASLFYSLPNTDGEDILYCIASKWQKKDDKVLIKLIQADGEIFECNREDPMLVNHVGHLNRFFYTVVVNYSHYSFNTIGVDGLKRGNPEDMYDDSGRPLFYKNGKPAREVGL